jgi:L-ascorbate metabolism protein UlaG (beta-lactamase superfamily)
MSSYFDGQRFHNQNRNLSRKSFKDFLTWRFKSKKQTWPKQINSQPLTYTQNTTPEKLRYTFINHATVLIEHQGITFLTDPLFSERASPFQFIGPKRVRKPAITPESLPKIDIILLSHNHYDHMDIPTLKWLAKRDNPLIITGLHNSIYLRKHNIHHTYELNWGKSYSHKGFEIYYEPAQHWSKRTLNDDFKALWGAFMVITPNNHKIYFAGDTGYTKHFKQMYKKHGSTDLALLPIGAYEPRWFMKNFHMNPDDAVQAHCDLQSKHSLAIHFGTFQLTDEAIDEPEKDLRIAIKKYNVSSDEFELPDWGISKIL